MALAQGRNHLHARRSRIQLGSQRPDCQHPSYHYGARGAFQAGYLQQPGSLFTYGVLRLFKRFAVAVVSSVDVGNASD